MTHPLRLASLGGGGTPNYIEECFSVWLYQGNGSTQTITNGIDLVGKGGLVWNKQRNGTFTHCLTDTVRGAGNSLDTSDTAANDYSITRVSAFNADGFTMGGNSRTNASSQTYASWTFRKQPKFFDVVTYTGNGANRTISHALGSVPGCIIVKRTDTTADWQVYHTSLANTEYMVLNTTAAKATGATRWNSTTPTASVFSLGTDTSVNASGGTYVAYVFAHNAGGFGLSGTDNVISCGSFTTDGSGNATVTLGYEPQWVMLKASSAAGTWLAIDSMRGMPVGASDASLFPNAISAESTSSDYISPTATGFTFSNAGYASITLIYIAIRRGPMKVPTLGTSVFAPIAANNTWTTTNTTNFPVDAQIVGYRPGASGWSPIMVDRLRGVSTTPNNSTYNSPALTTSSDASQAVSNTSTENWTNTGFGTPLSLAGDDIYWNFRRAPGFFDEVCYVGTGAANTVTHNLATAPELMLVKRRDTVANWWVYDATTGNAKYQVLNSTAIPVTSSTAWNNTTPTTSVFSVGTGTPVNASAGTYVALLFATCPGVSKVGSYTGNGSSQTINCGFTTGARFILIKRTDSTGDWYVWDSARGIVSANDPHLSLNTTAAEVTTDDSVDADTTGFIVNQLAATNVNVSGASYIFLSVA